MYPSSLPRFACLDGLRGLAALAVVCHHAILVHDYAIYSGLPEHSRFSWDLALSGMPFLFVASGDFAVSIFFVLSGFVLSHSWVHGRLGAAAAAVKRYARLTLPIAATSLLAFAVAVVLDGPLPGAPGPGRSAAELVAALRYCLAEAFLGSTVTGIRAPSYNGVLWTIPIEFQGSLAVLAVCLAARRLAPNSSSARRLIGAVALAALPFTWHSRLGLFAAGAAIYAFAGEGRNGRPQRRRFLIAALIVGCFLGTMPESPRRIAPYNALLVATGYDPTVAASTFVVHPLAAWLGLADPFPYRFTAVGLWHGVGAVLILLSVWKLPGARRLLESPVCHWLGTVSFPLYLVHSTVYRVVALAVHSSLTNAGFGYGTASLVAAACFIAASLAAAHCLARTIEAWSVRGADLLGRRVDTVLAAGRSSGG